MAGCDPGPGQSGPAAAADPAAQPLVGPDRYATSIVVARELFPSPSIVAVASGEAFPDALSGGEAVRMIFSKLMLAKDNVLVLDEPTNHLDLEAIAALVEGLKAFEGTVIFVSHDRAFIDATATRIVELDRGALRSYPGTWTAYEATKARELRNLQAGDHAEDARLFAIL